MVLCEVTAISRHFNACKLSFHLMYKYQASSRRRLHHYSTDSSPITEKLAMAAAAVLSPRDVQTTFNYFAPIDDEPPFQYTYQVPEGTRQNNIGQDTQPAVVHDVRGKEQEYGVGLDTSGFQFVKHESAEKDFTDEERIQSVYYKEVEELLKKEVGAKRVFIFDHTIRSVQAARTSHS